MTKMQYILLTAIIGFYVSLFIGLIVRTMLALWRGWGDVLGSRIEKLSPARVTSKMRNRAWTRAVWRGPLAPDVN